MSKKTKSISERAMLVSLKISMWTGRTKDDFVTDEVTTAKHSEKDSGAWWTYLVPKSELKAIDTARGRCRTLHDQLTMPWMDGGIRILAADMFMDYSSKMREAKAAYMQAVEEFLRKYPTIKAKAQERLGKLLEGKQLPSTDEIKSRFSINVEILPIPSANDFRVDLGDAQTDEVKHQVEENVKNMTAKAMTSLWSKLYELVEKMEATFKDPEKKFKKSTITNLTEFCEMIPKMNVADDEQLEEMRKVAMDKLSKLNAEDIKADKNTRKKAHKSAKDVLEKMKHYKRV